MARSLACLGAFAIGVLLTVPANAAQSGHGYIAVSKLQIDPHMDMLSDAPAPSQQAQQAPAPRGGQANRDGGTPLDQMDSTDDDGPAGDDPYSDNAVETDTVYTA